LSTQTVRPTKALRDDHVVVLDKLSTLGKAVKDLGSRDAARFHEEKGTIADILAFLEQDVELHLKKEEVGLFPALEAIMGRGGGPVGVMLMEHEDLRAKIAELRNYLNEDSGADVKQGTLAGIEGSASYICSLLTQHIYKEDHILLPMSEQMLSPEAMQEIADKFGELDKKSR